MKLYGDHVLISGSLLIQLPGRISKKHNARTRPRTRGTNCFAAFLGLHLTAGSSAYLEVNASHILFVPFVQSSMGRLFVCLFVGDLGLARGPRYRFFGAAYDYGFVSYRPFCSRSNGTDLDWGIAFSGRGIYSQSAGPVWMVSTPLERCPVSSDVELW